MPFATKKIGEIYYSRANTTFNLTEDIIKNLQELKGKTKLKFYRSIRFYYDEMNIRRQNNSFHFDEDPFSKNFQGIGKTYHEVLLLVKFKILYKSFQALLPI